MSGKNVTAPLCQGTATEAGNGAGLDVFQHLAYFRTRLSRTVWALERQRHSLSSCLNRIRGQLGIEGCGISLMIHQLLLAAAAGDHVT